MSISNLQVIDILNKIADVIEVNKIYLTELDAAIGDGDHGFNMSRGFEAVKAKLRSDQAEDIGEILKQVGMTLVSNVGGASGPLYGTAFMKAGVEAKEKVSIDINDYLKIIEAALEGIKMRGKATAGEKTMIDAIEPALIAMKTAKALDLPLLQILKDGKEAALEGVAYTKTIIATKGRASYLGERSIGHQDAGATSSYLMLNAVYEEVKRIVEGATS